MPFAIGTFPVIKTYICTEYMHRTYTILPFLLLAFAISLSSCVNEVKNPPMAQDTLARLVINYNIPDSNNILAVDFNALLTPLWKPQYRIDWNFGDSTGIISKFDTSILPHYYKKFGSYLVTLNVIDTLTKTILEKTSVVIDLKDNQIDTNYLHQFAKCKIIFLGVREYDKKNLEQQQITKTWTDYDSTFSFPFNDNLSLKWNGRYFQLSGGGSWNDSINYWQRDNGSNRFTFLGHISYRGNIIDSGTFSYSSSDSYSLRTGQGGDSKGTFFQYISIPFQKKDLDSMSFFYQGASLRQHIIQFLDSSNGGFNNSSYIYKQKNILWDQQPIPTLTITFYR